ncbi:hypothetical protein FRB90_000616 [Tulasnella sp. 427]|nr:hypothetical protein FRB90_000616 [Tulasnella sp. 427]
MPSRSRSNSSAAASYFPNAQAATTAAPYTHSNPVSRSNSNAAKGNSPYAPSRDLPPLPAHQHQQLSHSLTPRQSPASSPKLSSPASPANAQPAGSPNILPYSQPIPRPHRTRNDALHSLHRGSSLSGGSHSSPPSSHISRSSGSPPIPSTAGTTNNTRKSAASRQSGLRSSIVSGDSEWEDGDPTGRADPANDAARSSGIASNDGHISHAFGDDTMSSVGNDHTRSASPGPSSASYNSAVRTGSSFIASSRPPSGYQDSGRGSGYYGYHGENSSPMTADTSVAQSAASSPQQLKRAPSLHSRPSRSNLQMTAASPSSNNATGAGAAAGLGLSRSTSSGSLMNGGTAAAASRPGYGGQRISPGGRGLSRTTSATALNASARSSSGTNLNQLGKVGSSHGLSRSNSYSARSANFSRGGSPEPPVPPLPPNVQSMVEQNDAPIGMAATSDEPVQVSRQVNRSRASSITNQDAYNHTLGAGRTSWGGHPPPPHLNSQRSSEWGPLQEDDGEVSVSGTTSDLEGDADLEEDEEGDHTYNPAHLRQPSRGLQNGDSLRSSGLLPSGAPDVRPRSERTERYSVGSSIADENEWETDESGRKYRKAAPATRTDAEATDASEMSDSDFDEVVGRKKGLQDVEEDRTAAIIVAEEGQAVIAERKNDSLVGFDVKPGTTHLVIENTTTPDLAPSFLDHVFGFVPPTLLALDISGNQLTSLPIGLAECGALEELKIANNPLRSLPPWLANLHSLQVLMADSIELEFLPNELSALTGLKLISLRNNNLHSLPAWLCLLNGIEWLLVDNNPFLAPWLAILSPLLNALPATPGLTPRTPFSAVSGESTLTGDSLSPPHSAIPGRGRDDGLGNQTITLPNRMMFPNSGLTPTSAASSQPPYHIYTPSVSGFPMAPTPDSGRSAPSPLGLGTPSSASEAPMYPASATSYFPPTPLRANTSAAPPKNRRTYADGESGEVLRVPPMPPPVPNAPSPMPPRNDGAQSDSERRVLKKMKSADDVRKRARAGSVSAAVAAASQMFKNNTQPVPALPTASPMPSPMPSPGPNRMPLGPEATPDRKFMSLAMRSGSSLNQSPVHQRAALTNSLWEAPDNNHGQVNESPVDISDSSPRTESRTYNGPPPSKSSQFTPPSQDDDSREKGRKWGFLKKMSMGKMRAAAAGGTPDTVRSQKSTKGKRPSTGQTSRPPSEFGGRAPARQMGPPSSLVDSPSFHPFQDARIGLAPSASNGSLNGVPKAVDLSSPTLAPPPTTTRTGRRRSFLPLDGPPQLNIPIDKSPLMPSMPISGAGNAVERPEIAISPSDPPTNSSTGSNPSSARQSQNYQEILINGLPEQLFSALPSPAMNEAYAKALRLVMAYLRDLLDLGGLIPAPQTGAMPVPAVPPMIPGSNGSSPMPDRRRRPTLVGGEGHTDSIFSANFAPPPPRGLRSMPSTTSLRGGATVSTYTADSGGSGTGTGTEERKVKDDKAKRAHLVKEIVETERTYVKQLQELVDIYINPSGLSAGSITNKSETIVPGPERRIVFNGLEALFTFHMHNFLPVLEKKADPLMKRQAGSEVDGELSARVARDVAQVFVSHAAFMKMYSTYINNFDNCLARLKQWTTPPPPTIAPVAMTTNSSTAHVVGLGLSMSAMGALMPPETPTAISPLTNSQRKRIKEFLKRCRRNPKHSQLNLEGYLLLPIQRIPRYKLLLEQLVSSTPPRPDSYDDPIEKALEEISSLALNMNEGKRESESRKKLVQWQTRIGGSSKFPSPLVQPHRATGETVLIQVECLEPENTPRQLVAILCNDLLVLCKDPSRGHDKNAAVDLWAVLRMQTLPQPASIVNGHTINMHIPASRS